MHYRLRSVDDQIVGRLAASLRVHPATARCLAARGCVEPSEAQGFIDPRLAALRPPTGLAGLPRAVERLADAIQKKERIGVFGDYDVDGVTTAALLTSFFRAAGTEVVPAVAQRDAGYGFQPAAAAELARRGCSVIVTGDCGTSDLSALAAAAAFGIDVIVVDHHTVPSADTPHPSFSLVNPYRADSTFPFRGMASVGLAFYVAAAVRTELRDRGHFRTCREPDVRDYLDLVALGTIADLVPLNAENRILVALGLKRLRRTEQMRPGIAALLAGANVPEDKDVDERMIAWKIAPRINAPGRLGAAEPSLALLLADAATAPARAAVLEAANKERRAIQDRVLTEALAMLERNGGPPPTTGVDFAKGSLAEGSGGARFDVAAALAAASLSAADGPAGVEASAASSASTSANVTSGARAACTASTSADVTSGASANITSSDITSSSLTSVTSNVTSNATLKSSGTVGGRDVFDTSALDLVAQRPDIVLGPDASAIVVAGEGWPSGVVGIVAAKLVDKYQRPAFVVGIDPETGLGRGSARTAGGIDLYRALSDAWRAADVSGLAASASMSPRPTSATPQAPSDTTPDTLDRTAASTPASAAAPAVVTTTTTTTPTTASTTSGAAHWRFGGHAAAAGFTIGREAMAALADALGASCAKLAEGSGPQRAGKELDAEVRLADVDERLAQELSGLGPFGQANPPPLLIVRAARVTAVRRVGSSNAHLKLTLEETTGPTDRAPATRSAIGFNLGDREVEVGQLIDVAFLPTVSTWQGRRSAELEVHDFAPSEATTLELS